MSALTERFQQIKREQAERAHQAEIIREHLRARGLPTAIVDRPSQPAPEPERIHPVARRLSEILYDERISESERVRLAQIVSLVLADRRPS